MEDSLLVTNRQGETLVASIVRPDGLGGKLPVVLMTPGFGSKRKNSTNVRITELLVPLGVATIMLDLSGHGDSGGSIADQTLSKAKGEIEEVIKRIRSFDWIDSARVGLLGSSFSGNAMILYASADSHIAALALKSPITNYPEVRERQLGKDAIREWKHRGVITLPDGIVTKYRFYEDACHYNTYRAIRKVKAPISVVQGNQDEDIPVAHTEHLRKVLNPRKDSIVVIDGANHGYTRPSDFAQMIDILSKFLASRLLA